MSTRIEVVRDGSVTGSTEATVIASAFAPRLFRDTAGKAEAALGEATELMLFAPAGRYDDDVWTPVVERILERIPASVRRVAVVWSGLDSLTAGFGDQAHRIWSDPRLVPALLPKVERAAPALAALMRDRAGVEGLVPIDRGFVSFVPRDPAASSPDILVVLS